MDDAGFSSQFPTTTQQSLLEVATVARGTRSNRYESVVLLFKIRTPPTYITLPTPEILEERVD